jgi:hypothetical protein
LALAEAERVAKQHEAELLASLDGTVAVATTGQTEKARKKREKRRRQREAKRAASGGVVGGAAAARDDEPPAVGGHQAAARALPSVSGDDEHSWVAPRAPVKALRQVEHAAFPRARTNCDSGSETEMAESGEELEDAAKGGSQTPTGGGAPHWTGDLVRVESARVASARVQPASSVGPNAATTAAAVAGETAIAAATATTAALDPTGTDESAAATQATQAAKALSVDKLCRCLVCMRSFNSPVGMQSHLRAKHDKDHDQWRRTNPDSYVMRAKPLTEEERTCTWEDIVEKKRKRVDQSETKKKKMRRRSCEPLLKRRHNLRHASSVGFRCLGVNG